MPAHCPRSTCLARLTRLTRLTLLPLLATLLLSACGKPGAPAKAGPPGAAAAASAVLLLTPVDLLTLDTRLQASGPVITGSLLPERRADLRAELGAVVQQVLKDNGEPVRKGDLLVRLDDSAIRESLTSAEAAVRTASQTLEQTERQVQRQKTLQAQGMSTVQTLEDAELRRANSQSELVAARARASSAQQQLRRTEVRAPFDGVLSDRLVSVGDTVTIGRELLKVIDPRSLRFEGLVSADRLHELKPGQVVNFRVNGYPKSDFVGRLRRVDATANAATRQVAVLVDFADAASAPRVSGLFAEGRVDSGASVVLMLADSALQRAGEAAYAWRLDGEKIRKVALQLGERDARSGEFPVLSGLSAGDRVLRHPGSGLVDGQPVQWAAALPAGAASGAVAAASTASAAK